MNYVLSTPCPGHEFGLEDCEENITQRGWYTSGTFMCPPEGDTDDWSSYCDCEQLLMIIDGYKIGQLTQTYYDRVNVLLDSAEPEADYDDGGY